MKRLTSLYFLLLIHMLILFSYNIQEDSLKKIMVNFHTSMQQTQAYDRLYAESDIYWRSAIALYDRYILEQLSYNDLVRIPKIIHQIWLGSSLPEKSKKFRASWLKYHPDWQYILWTDKDIETLGLVNKTLYDSTTNYGAKSDIARYEILYRFGGLYIDTDFECLYPFDIFHHCCDFYAGFEHTSEFIIFNGLIGSIPGHIILQTAIAKLGQYLDSFNSWSDILNQTGPFFFTRCIKHEIKNDIGRTVIFPTSYFYPWPWIARDNNTLEQINAWIKPETFAIHHWHASWNGGNIG